MFYQFLASGLLKKRQKFSANSRALCQKGMGKELLVFVQEFRLRVARLLETTRLNKLKLSKHLMLLKHQSTGIKK